MTKALPPLKLTVQTVESVGPAPEGWTHVVKNLGWATFDENGNVALLSDNEALLLFSDVYDECFTKPPHDR
jgi:hypothetical protein